MLEEKNPQRTSLEQLGEFGLIEHLTKNFSVQQASTIKAIGDDAAVLDMTNGQTVLSTDMLVENVHFDLSYMPLKHLGYKAVMVNLSDIYAMNATATQITVSIAVSNRFPLEALEEFYEGVALAAQIYNVDLIGGDTTSSSKGMIISITAIGTVSEEEVTYRSGAKPQDLLVVTGDLGGAYAGLQILEREKEVFKVNPNSNPDLSAYTYIVERQLKPEARKDMVELLKALDVKPTAMIDISDGLSSEVLHLCKSSGVGCNVYENKIPLDPTTIGACEEFKLDGTIAAMSGGEDYELLFTIDQSDFDKIKGNPNLTVIGHMTDVQEGVHMVTRSNSQVAITSQGWNSFTAES